TDAELDSVLTIGMLKIGDVNSGAITISTPLSQANRVLSLQSSSSVIQNAGATIGITNNSLAVRAGGNIQLDQGNSVNDFAATTTAGTITYYELSSALSLGTVDGLVGVTAPNTSINVYATGNLTVPSTGQADAGTGNVSLSANAVGNTLTINALVRGT